MLEVLTTKGPVIGRPCSCGEGSVFLGIPYAGAPVGNLRFKAPVPRDEWTEPLECTEFGASPVQVKGHPGSREYTVSEDCLSLNVYTPAKTDKDNLPVMVWIYGGAFSSGSSADPEFNGEKLMQKSVVVVTFNYRTGPLGFFVTEELEKKNGECLNNGILDQIAALNWVHENIRAFGGNPEKILVHGQSAGGISTRILLTSPMTAGLISKVIVQSGGGCIEADPYRTKEEFSKLCQKAMDYLGWSTEDLYSRSGQEICEKLSKAARETADSFEVGYFQPFIDGKTVVDIPGKLIAEGKYPDIPVICGNVSGDAWMFSRKVNQSFPKEDSDDLYKGFALASGISWARWAQNNKKKPVYTYYFDRTQPGQPDMGKGTRPPMWGSNTPHTAEIPYVFGTLKERSNLYSEYDNGLSELMQIYWTNFAKSGNPNGEGLEKWEAYTQENPVTMHIGDKVYGCEKMIEGNSMEKVIEASCSNPGMIEAL